MSARYPAVMSGAIASLLGALVGGLAAIGGAWLQARSTARLQREEAARQEEHRQAERTALLRDRRRVLARRRLFQLGDAVDSLRHRVNNWANRGGLEYSEGRFPGYWEVTSLYAVARALGPNASWTWRAYMSNSGQSPWTRPQTTPGTPSNRPSRKHSAFSATTAWLSPRQYWTAQATSSGS